MGAEAQRVGEGDVSCPARIENATRLSCPDQQLDRIGDAIQYETEEWLVVAGVRFFEGGQIFRTSIDGDNRVWETISQQVVIHHQPGSPSVAIRERMNCDHVVVQFRRLHDGGNVRPIRSLDDRRYKLRKFMWACPLYVDVFHHQSMDIENILLGHRMGRCVTLDGA